MANEQHINVNSLHRYTPHGKKRQVRNHIFTIISQFIVIYNLSKINVNLWQYWLPGFQKTAERMNKVISCVRTKAKWLMILGPCLLSTALTTVKSLYGKTVRNNINIHVKLSINQLNFHWIWHVSGLFYRALIWCLISKVNAMVAKLSEVIIIKW